MTILVEEGAGITTGALLISILISANGQKVTVIFRYLELFWSFQYLEVPVTIQNHLIYIQHSTINGNAHGTFTLTAFLCGSFNLPFRTENLDSGISEIFIFVLLLGVSN